ncbi:MAG: PilZ domain-containing protein [Deltaproteobacteria bacterium]
MLFFSREEKKLDERSAEDRRLFARIKAEVLLRCLEKQQEKMGITMDISAQGLGMVSSEWFKPASQVDIYLKFPCTRDELVTAGKVVWCQKVANNRYRIGILLDKPELMAVAQLMTGTRRAG